MPTVAQITGQPRRSQKQQKKRRPRLDGVGRLTKEQKDARDAQMHHLIAHVLPILRVARATYGDRRPIFTLSAGEVLRGPEVTK